ncbi:uncharacterized protein LOC134696721 [Mytilus trossulus]|uniref:uncharacterized protein LOC134696721 n=1 Tax=Mytilus trossulus TaxID=6551 RepID=UPI003004D4B0
MCPHVLQNQGFAQVTKRDDDSYVDTENHTSMQQDIFDSRQLKRCEKNFPPFIKRMRNSVKQAAGVYWTHLAIFCGKNKFIVSLLKYCKKKMYDVPLFTLLHKLSVPLLSVLHENSSIMYEVVSNYPRSIISAPINFTVYKNRKVLNCDYGAFSLVLELTMFNDFKILYKIVRNDQCLLKEANLSGMEFCNLLSDTMNNLMIHKHVDDLEYLLSVKKLPLESYASLFYLIYKSDARSIYSTIFDKSDFCSRFLSWKTKVIKKKSKLLTAILFTSILHGDTVAINKFVEYGFNVNTEVNECSILVWAEQLNFPEIVAILLKAGSRRVANRMYKEFRNVIMTYEDYYAKLADPEYNRISVLHRLYENTNPSVFFYTNPAIQSLTTAVPSFHVMKYLLLHDKGLRNIDDFLFMLPYYSIYDSHIFHLIIRSNSSMRLQVRDIDRIVEFKSLSCNLDNDALFELLSEITNYSLSTNEIKAFEKNTLTELPCLPVKTLKSFCRNKLRLHYRGYQLFKCLNILNGTIPSSVCSFLLKEDVLKLFLSVKQLNRMDEDSSDADKYFI